LTDFLTRRIAKPPRSLAARVALGGALGIAALALRVGLAPVLGPGTPFVAFMVAVFVASIFTGASGGATCVAVVAVSSPLLLHPDAGQMAERRRLLGELFFLGASGFVIWMTALLRAALAREVAAREAGRLLQLELQHRVKNTLAVVQSLAEQTLRGAKDIDAARRDFADRLVALSEAHDVLVDAGLREVTVGAVAERALAAFRPADPARLELDGGPAPVPPDAAVALALCLHELATNAAKYGALSGAQGQVRLGWRIVEAGGRRRLEIQWRETGGPPVRPRHRQGFGSRLLARALAAQPNARTSLSLPPEGAVWTAAFDLAAG
jgi:two-component sensor histidine kinase